MSFNLNINKLFCVCSPKKTKYNEKNLREELKKSITNAFALNNGLVAFEIVLGKLLSYLNADYGIISMAMSNGITSFRNLASYGIHLKDRMYLKHWINVPVYYNDEVYVGLFAIGGIDMNTDRLNNMNDKLNIIAKELYKYRKENYLAYDEKDK